jgi:phosphoglycolate phosphatase
MACVPSEGDFAASAEDACRVGTKCDWPRAILFDLDGTLVDSVPAIAASTNRLLADEGLAPLDVRDVRRIIGKGSGSLIRSAFQARDVSLSKKALSVMIDRLMWIYADHLTTHSALRDHALATVSAYAGSGVRIAVVSNKPEAFSRRIIKHFSLADHVAMVVGGDSGERRKPAPDMLSHALAKLQVDARDGLMVGDSPADIMAARAVPMASIAVRGGYTAVPENLGADCVIDDLAGLPQAIRLFRVGV